MSAEESKLTIHKFLRKATKNDPYFKEILISQLFSRYDKVIKLPSSDLLLAISSQYNLIIRRINDPIYDNDISNDDSLQSAFVLSELSKRSEKMSYSGGQEGKIALSKLFPYTGTEFSINYSVNRILLSRGPVNRSAFSAQISQDIAQNAFGRITRKQSLVIGIENELAHYQAIEAHEEYLSALMALYLDWYSTYENLQAAKSIFNYTQKLYAFVQRKRRYRISLPEDVDKIYLQQLNAQETVITLEDKYLRLANNIKETAGLTDKKWQPINPLIDDPTVDLIKTNIYKKINQSRTMKMLQLLNQKGVLTTEIEKHRLLPSASFFTGYSMQGFDYDIKSPDRKLYAGLSLEFSFGRHKEKASLAIAQLNQRNDQLKKSSSLLVFRKNLFSLYSELQRENKLIQISRNKRKMARRILNAERRNYNIGKTTLNELIKAQNDLIKSEYDAIHHNILYQKLLLQWQRLTDVLVEKI